MIEGEVNNILAQIVEFGMQLEIDGKNINRLLSVWRPEVEFGNV